MQIHFDDSRESTKLVLYWYKNPVIKVSCSDNFTALQLLDTYVYTKLTEFEVKGDLGFHWYSTNLVSTLPNKTKYHRVKIELSNPL